MNAVKVATAGDYIRAFVAHPDLAQIRWRLLLHQSITWPDTGMRISACSGSSVSEVTWPSNSPGVLSLELAQVKSGSWLDLDGWDNFTSQGQADTPVQGVICQNDGNSFQVTRDPLCIPLGAVLGIFVKYHAQIDDSRGQFIRDVCKKGSAFGALLNRILRERYQFATHFLNFFVYDGGADRDDRLAIRPSRRFRPDLVVG